MLLSFSKRIIEAGCDEAGRGCLAGPVFAAAVILPKRFKHPKLRDSKKLTPADRYELRAYIEKHALCWSVGQVDEQEIDRINILNASFKAMHQAIDGLMIRPELLLIDGNRFNSYHQIPHECIIGGDDKYAPIAAASILAKTYRDDYMLRLSEQFPQYGWDANKGYATLAHRVAMNDLGQTRFHRRSFVLKHQPTLF
jgi:ribonuclease HII